MFSLFVSPPMTLLYARYPAASLPLLILARLIYSGLSGVLDGVRTKVVIQFHDQFLKRLVNTRVVMMSATLNDPSVACRCTAVIDDWSGPEAEEYAVKHLRMLMPGEPVTTVFNFDSAGKRLFQQGSSTPAFITSSAPIQSCCSHSITNESSMPGFKS